MSSGIVQWRGREPTGFVESGERSKHCAMRQASPKNASALTAMHKGAQAPACWFSLMVAREQERVADGRFWWNMARYLYITSHLVD